MRVSKEKINLYSFVVMAEERKNMVWAMNRVFHLTLYIKVRVFNATFNNISVISWRSVLLMKETRVPEENHRSAASY